MKKKNSFFDSVCQAGRQLEVRREEDERRTRGDRVGDSGSRDDIPGENNRIRSISCVDTRKFSTFTTKRKFANEIS